MKEIHLIVFLPYIFPHEDKEDGKMVKGFTYQLKEDLALKNEPYKAILNVSIGIADDSEGHLEVIEW